MAPVTRSKTPKASAIPTAAPTAAKKKVGKVQKARREKKAIAAKISKPAKKAPSKKNHQGKATKLPLMVTTSATRSRDRRMMPEPSIPEPLEDDWELAESYRILPYLDSPEFATYSSARASGRKKARSVSPAPVPRSFSIHGLSDSSPNGNSRQKPASRGFLAGMPHITATPPPTAVHPYNRLGFVERPGRNSPPSVHFEDTTGQRKGWGTGSSAAIASNHSSSSSGRVKLADMPAYVDPVATRSPLSNVSRPSSRSSDLILVGTAAPAPSVSTASKKAKARRRDSSVVREILAQVPTASTPTRKSSRRTSSVVRGIVDQVERQSPETPVSVSNAQVFKRPTVATVRRERAQMVDELSELAVKLAGARRTFEEVIEALEDRVRILKAVNRMQAPLKKAPLGRGRKRG